jgi:hypothetical protein
MGTARVIFAHGNARIPMIRRSLIDSPKFWTKNLVVLPGKKGFASSLPSKMKSLFLKENTRRASCRRSATTRRKAGNCQLPRTQSRESSSCNGNAKFLIVFSANIIKLSY